METVGTSSGDMYSREPFLLLLGAIWVPDLHNFELTMKGLPFPVRFLASGNHLLSFNELILRKGKNYQQTSELYSKP